MKKKHDAIIESYKYAGAVSEAIFNLFKESGNEDAMYSLKTINGTEFFTGVIQGVAQVYNQLAGDEKNFLEFTHLANQLIVQSLVQQAEEGEELVIDNDDMEEA